MSSVYSVPDVPGLGPLPAQLPRGRYRQSQRVATAMVSTVSGAPTFRFVCRVAEANALDATACGYALGYVNGRRVLPLLGPSVRHQSRQPSAIQPAARRRSGVWRCSCRGLAGRLRHGDTLKDLPDKDMRLYRCQPFGNRARVYPQSEHGPGVAGCFGLNHDLPDHRQFSVPPWAGKTTSLFA